MNRRNFLLASTGCAVAAATPSAKTLIHPMDFSATSESFGTVFWVCNLDTGKWRQVAEEEFMTGVPG